MISATLNTLATLPIQHHTEVGLLMAALCLITGMLLASLWQQVHEPRVAYAVQAPVFEKAPVWQYVLAELLAPAPCSIDKFLRDINR